LFDALKPRKTRIFLGYIKNAWDICNVITQKIMNSTSKYLKNYFNEKQIPFQIFEVVDNTGTTHFINTDVIIECIQATGMGEKLAIANTLKKLDYYNAGFDKYFKFLAGILVKKKFA
jgi:hypothetical protein